MTINTFQTNPSMGSLFIISAASGTGKTSLLSKCLEHNPQLSVSVSHTTRPPRAGEVDGINYHFVDKSSFETMITDNHFLESATVFGNYYGTAESEVHNKLKAGHDLVLEIDWQGAQQVRKRFKDVVSIFILPPSLKVLKQRLSDRGQDDAEVIEHRLAKAQEEISHYPEFDYLVINDDFDRALKELNAIFLNYQILKKAQSPLCQNLLNELLKPQS